MAPDFYGQQVGLTTIYGTTTAVYLNCPDSIVSYSPRRRHAERIRRNKAKAYFPVYAKDAGPGVGDVEWQTEMPPRAHEHRTPARAVATVRGHRPMRGRSGRPHDGITVS